MPEGKLYLVATPIGNLEDITLRALRILREADLIACEDTRHTAKLLQHFGISKPRLSYHEHNESIRTRQLLVLLRSGKSIALVSDAGTPVVSDPGRILVTACRKEGIKVVPIPGPAAAIAALTGSGLPAEDFRFAGFLPSRCSARRKALEGLAGCPATLVFYESPHRLVSSLEDMLLVLGPRPACLARELTKVHEEWIRGGLCEIVAEIKERPRIQGEITLIVAGAEPSVVPASWPESLQEHLEEEVRKTGASRKDALKAVARQRNLSRREAYRLLLEEK